MTSMNVSVRKTWLNDNISCIVKTTLGKTVHNNGTFYMGQIPQRTTITSLYIEKRKKNKNILKFGN